MKPLEIELMTAAALRSIDRWSLERRARAVASPVYLGEGVVLCRIMGRYKLYVDTTDIGFGSHVMLDGLWESWLTVFMARLIEPGMNVVDVGANHGYYTVMFADLAGPTGRVAAIEPHPLLVSLLKRSVGINPNGSNVEIFDHAVGAVDDTRVAMYMPKGEPKNSRVVNTRVEVVPMDRKFKMRSETIDKVLNHWPRVDFLKIDVEGAEEAVLEGMTRILERDRPKMVLEFNVGRCQDPAALLDKLLEIYGTIRVVDFHCRATAVDRATLLDPAHTEDWLLYLADR